MPRLADRDSSSARSGPSLASTRRACPPVAMPAKARIRMSWPLRLISEPAVATTNASAGDAELCAQVDGGVIEPGEIDSVGDDAGAFGRHAVCDQAVIDLARYADDENCGMQQECVAVAAQIIDVQMCQHRQAGAERCGYQATARARRCWRGAHRCRVRGTGCGRFAPDRGNAAGSAAANHSAGNTGIRCGWWDSRRPLRHRPWRRRCTTPPAGSWFCRARATGRAGRSRCRESTHRRNA